MLTRSASSQLSGIKRHQSARDDTSRHARNPDLGAGGREFESPHPDTTSRTLTGSAGSYTVGSRQSVRDADQRGSGLAAQLIPRDQPARHVPARPAAGSANRHPTGSNSATGVRRGFTWQRWGICGPCLGTAPIARPRRTPLALRLDSMNGVREMAILVTAILVAVIAALIFVMLFDVMRQNREQDGGIQPSFRGGRVAWALVALRGPSERSDRRQLPCVPVNDQSTSR